MQIKNMYFYDKNPYKLLQEAGYQMVGKSNVFRRHIDDLSWFHCFIQPDKKGVKIHFDWVKNKDCIKQRYSRHQTKQNGKNIANEIERIMEFRGGCIKKIIEKILWITN
jgi:hypothetical protein